AEAARARLPRFSFAALWQAAVDSLLAGGRLRRGQQAPAWEQRRGLSLAGRVWRQLSRATPLPADPRLVPALRAATTAPEQSSHPWHARGLLAPVAEAIGAFRRAGGEEGRHLLAGVNLVEALASLGQTREAIKQTRRILRVLENQTKPTLGQVASAYPPQ